MAGLMKNIGCCQRETIWGVTFQIFLKIIMVSTVFSDQTFELINVFSFDFVMCAFLDHVNKFSAFI